MGLSTSLSNAQKERVEKLSIKRAKSATNSQMRSVNKYSEIKDEAGIPYLMNSAKDKFNVKEMKVQIQEIINNLSSKKQDNLEQVGTEEPVPTILIIPPRQSIVSQQITKQIQDLPEIIEQKYIQPPLMNENMQSLSQSNIKYQLYQKDMVYQQQSYVNQNEESRKLGQNFFLQQKEQQQNIKLENDSELLDNSLVNSRSKPFQFKVQPLTIDHQNIEFHDDIEPSDSFQDQFINYDWKIPKSTTYGKISSNRKKLKPQKSVVLINKSRIYDNQFQKSQSRWSKNCKNRRQLMYEIVDGRIKSVDGDLNLLGCIQKSKDKQLRNIRQICL